jgi:hypothetical protein
MAAYFKEDVRFFYILKAKGKFRVPRKQGAHFLSARAQIQDSWVFSSLA